MSLLSSFSHVTETGFRHPDGHHESFPLVTSKVPMRFVLLPFSSFTMNSTPPRFTWMHPASIHTLWAITYHSCSCPHLVALGRKRGRVFSFVFRLRPWKSPDGFTEGGTRPCMDASLALVAPSLNFPGFNRASRCVGRKTVKLSMAYYLKIRGSFQVPRGRDRAFNNSSAPIHPSVKHRAFQCLIWILHDYLRNLTRPDKLFITYICSEQTYVYS